MNNNKNKNKKYGTRFPSVPSQYSNQSQSNNSQIRYYNNNKYPSQQQQQQELSQIYQNNKQMIVDFENLDIQPIQNTTGDKFFIDQQDQHNINYSLNYTPQQSKIQWIESSVWIDVYFAKKNIMNLLQQRNDVCEMYNLNSKSLKQISNTLKNNRIYTDLEISKYIKQLFQQSPSYEQYDLMCFAIIPQLSSLAQKYFVFMGGDNKFVPQCKWCNVSAYLILNVQLKQKPVRSTLSNFGDKLKKSAIIKGKILCSNSKCKKKLLGQFVISQQQSNPNKINILNRQNTQSSQNKYHQKRQQNYKNHQRIQTQQIQKKKQPQLSQKQRILLKKAAMKVNL